MAKRLKHESYLPRFLDDLGADGGRCAVGFAGGCAEAGADGLALLQVAVTGLLWTVDSQGGGAAAVGAAVGVAMGVGVPVVEVGVAEAGAVDAVGTGIFVSFIICIFKIWLLLKLPSSLILHRKCHDRISFPSTLVTS